MPTAHVPHAAMTAVAVSVTGGLAPETVTMPPWVVHRCPAIAVPVGDALTAVGVLITAAVGILRAAVS